MFKTLTQGAISTSSMCTIATATARASAPLGGFLRTARENPLSSTAYDLGDPREGRCKGLALMYGAGD